jgi:hypothetical protein
MNTCEHVIKWDGETAEFCGKPTEWRYPAMGGGHMHLCDEHAERFKPHAKVMQMEKVG